ncbi:MAG: GreA/GreB family elongation factor, partial [Chloroflexi bacterium]|nr:GreA/GreB family elongation factor [Chloroflexota bacterium]
MERRETFLTAGGLTKLEGELDNLRSVRRQEVAQRIQHAKELGGTVDNADYEEAKNEQAFIEGRILTLGVMIKSAVVIPEDRTPSDKVEVGSAVTVVNPQGKTQTYHIVGSTEADPSQGKIS